MKTESKMFDIVRKQVDVKRRNRNQMYALQFREPNVLKPVVRLHREALKPAQVILLPQKHSPD